MPTNAEVEAIAATVPSAPELQKQQAEKLRQEREKQADRQVRMFCIEQATKACAAGGYEPKDIMEVVSGYYKFINTNK